MSLSNKLVAGFLIIFATILVAAWLAFVATSGLRQSLEETFERPFVAVTHARASLPRVVEIRRIIDRSLVAAEFKRDDRQTLIAIRTALRRDVAVIVQRTQSDDVRRLAGIMLADADQIAERFQRLETGELSQLALLLAESDRLQRDTEALIAAVVAEALVFRDRAEAQAETRLFTVWAALALCCLVALTLGLVMHKTVVRPLRIAIEALEELAEGARAVHLPDSAWGEVGRLSRVLRLLFERHRQNEMAREEHYRARIESETRRAEELRFERNRAEAANRAKSEFLANMSHELRTPLNAILGFSELIVDARSDVAPQLRDYAGHVQTSGRHLLDLINDLLDTARIESGELRIRRQDIELLTLIEDMITLVRPEAEARNLLIRLDTGDLTSGTRIRADRRAMRQILLNLLSNAVKFSRKGGDVTVRLEAGADDGLALEIADRGIGIAPEDLERVFERFEQVEGALSRDHGGTGIGLPLSRALAELHDGSLTLESRTGDGTTARLVLPDCLLKPAAAPAADAADDRTTTGTPPVPVRDLRILVVEDQPANRAVLRKILESLGHVAQAVANGRDGVAAVLREPFDLVLMDVQMPGMDGLDATRKIRSLEGAGRRIPIVAVTANAGEADRRDCLDSGMDGYITKPVSRADIAAAIAAVVSVPPASSCERANAVERASEPARAPDPVADEAAGPPLFDREIVDGLLGQTGEEAFRAIVADLGRECDECLAEIGRAVETRAVEALRTAVQRLDSTFVSLGGTAVRAAAAGITDALAENRGKDLPALATAFELSCRSSLASLRAWPTAAVRDTARAG